MPTQLYMIITYSSYNRLYYVIIPPMENMLLRIPVAAHLLGIHSQTLRRLCARKMIPCSDIGTGGMRCYRIPLDYVRRALRGEARWKFPPQLRRKAITERTADMLIKQGLEEWKTIQANETRWSNDIEDEA